MAQRPYIVLVGGAWHKVHYLEPLSRIMKDAGYEVLSLSLPSAGAVPPAKSSDGDIAYIRNSVKLLIQQGRQVVVVLHSISGICGTNALNGLGRAEAAGAGVRAIVYLAGIVPQLGFSFDTHLESMGDRTWKAAKAFWNKDGYVVMPPGIGANLLYGDLEPKKVEYYCSELVPQSIGVYNSPLVHESYKQIYSGYLLTSEDNCLPYEFQQQTLRKLKFPPHNTIVLPTGHCPWLTRPDEVRDFILDISDRASALPDLSPPSPKLLARNRSRDRTSTPTPPAGAPRRTTRRARRWYRTVFSWSSLFSERRKLDNEQTESA